jgi:hypothetical protein
MIAVTHISKCDDPACVNYGIEFPVKTSDGVLHVVWCAPCDRDITHTCVPV